MIGFVAGVILIGVVVVLAVAGLLSWEPWRMLHRPQHAAGRLRVDLPYLSATVPIAAVQGGPPWPCLPREWIEVHHDEFPHDHARPVALLPVPAPDLPAVAAPVPRDADTPPLSAPPSPLPGRIRAVGEAAIDARQLPHTAAWLRAAARRDGVAAWFARELAAA